MFFETLFNLQGLTGEQIVCCPFPHTKADGTTYYDHNPSCCVNLDKRVYVCKSCGKSGNESQMVQDLFKTTSVKAKNFLTMLNRNTTREQIEEQYNATPLSAECREMAMSFGISEDILRECMVTIEKDGAFFNWEIPVMWNGVCIDIRHYRPGRNPKMLGEPGAPTGTIIPYDSFIQEPENRWVILCAGEKDMLVTRSKGFNAITFTGGEMMRTPLDATVFRGRKVAICYDNDQPGRTGAVNIAEVLTKAGASDVRVITKFHDDFDTTDSKEDLTDWFTKYDGTPELLKQYIQNTPTYEPQQLEEVSDIPLVKLHDVLPTECIGKTYRSNIQVISVSDEPLDVPSKASIKKLSAEKGAMAVGDTIMFDLTEDEEHLTHIFDLVGKNLTACQNNIKKACGISDRGIVVRILDRVNVHVCTVADIDATFESMQEFTCYCVGFKPLQGKRYEMQYIRMTDTAHGSACLLCLQVQEDSDIITHWELTPQTMASLTYAQHVQGTVQDKISHRARAVRGLLGYEADENMITAIDLVFNTVKEFNYGTSTNIKGYMDALIVGESRVGKSDTAKHLRDVYDVGSFVSLAGSAATIPGIVGGSTKDAMGRLSTRAGVIPRNHESIVVFEELAKADPSILKSLTDVRSSGLARITRVSGSIEMPAALRMLTLSNVRPTDTGVTRPLSAYSGGVEVLTELIGTAEDIARYDLTMLVGDPENINPMYNAEEPYPTEVLRDLIQWVWSRKADDVVWADGSDMLVKTLSEQLNEQFPLHIKIFGSECWKKLARLSIAAACYTVSTDSEYEKVLVTPEHVRWAKSFMLRVYDNNLYKLSDTCRIHQHSTQPNADDTAKLQEYYVRYSCAIDMLYESGRLNKDVFKDLANVEDALGTAIIKVLVVRHFAEVDRQNIYATVKFKSTYPLLDKNIEVSRI